MRNRILVGVTLGLASLSASAASFTPLGDLSGGSFYSEARGVSADGSVVVGLGTSGSGTEAFRWTTAGMSGLGDLSGGSFYSEARGVSADGSVVVGIGTSGSGTEAFLWTAGGGMQRLLDVLVTQGATGLTGWTLREAFGISGDGTWVVGYGTNPTGQSEAFRANITITPIPVPGAAWLIAPAFGLLAPWVKRRAKSAA